MSTHELQNNALPKERSFFKFVLTDTYVPTEYKPEVKNWAIGNRIAAGLIGGLGVLSYLNQETPLPTITGVGAALLLVSVMARILYKEQIEDL